MRAATISNAAGAMPVCSTSKIRNRLRSCTDAAAESTPTVSQSVQQLAGWLAGWLAGSLFADSHLSFLLPTLVSLFIHPAHRYVAGSGPRFVLGDADGLVGQLLGALIQVSRHAKVDI